MADPLCRVALGRTGLMVTQLGLGGAPLGNLFTPVSDAEAQATIERAWDLGLRFFDTAPLYGHGLSERRIGAALRNRPRAELVLATKVGRLLVPSSVQRAAPLIDTDEPSMFVNVPPVHVVFDFSFDATLRSVDESLTRLGLAAVDVLHVHDPDAHAEDALRGAFPALRRLRDEGVIRAVGAGMNQSELLARFVREADVDCVLLAGRYTLLDQSGLDELLPLCTARGVAIIAGGVFNSGVLADPRPGATYNYVSAPADVLERARRLQAACERHGVPLRAAALQFPLAHPAVACVLTGARSVAEIGENAALFARPIPPALWTDLRREGLLRDGTPTPQMSPA